MKIQLQREEVLSGVFPSFTLLTPVLTSQFDFKYLLHEKAVINFSLSKTSEALRPRICKIISFKNGKLLLRHQLMSDEASGFNKTKHVEITQGE